MTFMTQNFLEVLPYASSNPITFSPKPAEKIIIEFIDGTRWDRLANQFDDVVCEQIDCFNTARWGEGNIENLVFRQYGEVIGGASVVVFSAPLLNTGIAIVKWGPLWRKAGELVETDRLTEMLALLQNEFCKQRGLYLTIMPPADLDYAQEYSQSLQLLGFETGALLPAPERYLVDVSINPDELRKSLAQKWRYNLKKAEKRDFNICFADDEQGFETFMELYENMLERKKFNDTSQIHTLKTMMASKNPALRPRIVLLSHQGEITAGAVIDTSGDRAVYLYGATNDRALELNAGYAIHWFIAKHLMNCPKTNWYDLGGNDSDGGLHQFKKGFIGKTGVLCETPPAYHYAASNKALMVGKTVFALKKFKTMLSGKSGLRK